MFVVASCSEFVVYRLLFDVCYLLCVVSSF